MYCVKCGVELADSQRVCPLCGTRVFHPDIPRTPADPPYPPDERVHPEEVNRSGVEGKRTPQAPYFTGRKTGRKDLFHSGVWAHPLRKCGILQL